MFASPSFPPFHDAEELEPFTDLGPNIAELSDEIRLCKTKDVTEDEWCHRLVYPMLQLAAKRLSGTRRIEIAAMSVATHPAIRTIKLTLDSKTIDISPSSLLPTTGGIPSQSKRVDYTICTQLDDSQRLDNLFHGGGGSVNQTNHFRLHGHVLLSPVEVKRKSTGRDGELQLAVWTAAGFKRIQELMEWMKEANKNQDISTETSSDRESANSWPSVRPDRETPLPAVQPLWLWEGDELELSVAFMRGKDELRIYRMVQWHLERDADLLGAIICLARVMDWALEHYLPWFKKVVL